MTVVEFYDRSPIENILSLLSFSPDRVILIGDEECMKQEKARYDRFLRALSARVPFEYRAIRKDDLQHTIEVLTRIVLENEDCIFDLTGGGDLMLAAMGMVFERYRNKRHIRMHRFDLQSGKIYNAADQTVLSVPSPALTIEQLVLLYGGIIGGSTDGDAPVAWDLSDAFCHALDRLWAMNREDPAYFNKQISRLCEMEKYKQSSAEPLRIRLEDSVLRARIDRYTEKRETVLRFLKKLAQEDIIDLHSTSGKLDFVYRDPQIKRCLSKAGNLLELKTLATAIALRDDNGKTLITDALCGVYIDWDGQFASSSDAGHDTLNEIDVMLMRGVTPIFVSCKNGTVDDTELYKLSVVADHFGGTYAKKVLVATYMERHPSVREHLKQRAADMGIVLIDNVHQLSDERFCQALKAACL